MAYNETKLHGTEDFPFQLYKIDSNHPKYEMVMHWHNNIEIIKIVKGTLNLSLNNEKYIAQEGETYFVNSEVLHGAIPNNCVYQCLVFNLEFLKNGNSTCDTFLEDLLSHHTYVFEKLTHHTLLPIIDKLFYSMDSTLEGYQFLTIGAINELLAQIKINKLYDSKTLESVDKDAKNANKLKKTLYFMRANFDKDLTIKDIAEVSGFSIKYFCLFFKKETGKTPFEYLNDYRIEKASTKLLTTDLEITQIAYSCGFNDLSYFIKTFKKIKNITPKNYRKLVLDV